MFELMFYILQLLWETVFLWMGLGVFTAHFLKLKNLWLTQTFKWVVVNFLLPIMIYSTVLDNLPVERISVLYQYIPWAMFFYSTALGLSFFYAKKIKIKTHAPSFHLGNSIHNYGLMAYGLISELFGPATLSECFVFVLTMEVILWSSAVRLFQTNKNIFSVLLNPPLSALFLSIFLKIFLGEATLSQLNFDFIRFLSGLAVPSAITILGGMSYFAFREIKNSLIFSRDSLVAISFRHILFPMIAVCAIGLLLQAGTLRDNLMIECIMPAALFPMALAAMYKGDYRYLGAFAGVSTLLAVVTIPLWLIFFQSMGWMQINLPS